jgi:hypothetical protein
VLLTLPFDIRDCDAVPLVIRDVETLPLVILLALALGAIMRLPSPMPRSSSGKDVDLGRLFRAIGLLHRRHADE